MSLYELFTMVRAWHERQRAASGKGRQVSDEEWAEAEELLASVTLHDPSVMIH